MGCGHGFRFLESPDAPPLFETPMIKLAFDQRFALSPLSACLALAFPLWSGHSMAASTFEASGAYSIGPDRSGGTSKPKSGGFQLSATDGPVADGANGIASSYWDSSAALAASSTGDGHFGSSVATHESYGSTSLMTSNVKLVYRDTLVNTSSFDQQASFAIDIASLQFGFNFGTRYGTNRASFAASLYVDGQAAPVWSSTFSYDDGLQAYVATGADIGLAAALPATCSNYGNPQPQTDCSFRSGGFSIGNYQTTVSLGPVAAQQSIGIHYEVDLSTETDMYGGTASVVFNDPSGLSSDGAAAGDLRFDSSTDPVVVAVPEPETYAMMAAGLGLLAVARRRRGR